MSRDEVKKQLLESGVGSIIAEVMSGTIASWIRDSYYKGRNDGINESFKTIRENLK